jgi:hypothetical protein|uniref:DUF834 domain-containing protein n=1 Tax=Oryza sativa subsp. japonica TaxID=39947 RepID=Q6H4B8_ORYSJ|nr:hypothetical protein [Oryza sativa Japonica Group]BAD26431.1 hypothetical protein [Oryza sativa Japonica Group]
MALDNNSAGDRELGRLNRRHLHEEYDEANSPVQRTTTDDNERRPTTSSDGGTARLDVSGGPPVACDGCEGAAEMLLHLANPTVATESGGDDDSGRAARLKQRRRRRR